MAVFESTANVHSVSLAFSLPATTTLSGDADFTVPWAFLAFIFISAGFGFASAGFCVGAGVVAGAGRARERGSASAQRQFRRLRFRIPVQSVAPQISSRWSLLRYRLGLEASYCL